VRAVLRVEVELLTVMNQVVGRTSVLIMIVQIITDSVSYKVLI
jgi:hypothetical protein